MKKKFNAFQVIGFLLIVVGLILVIKPSFLGSIMGSEFFTEQTGRGSASWHDPVLNKDIGMYWSGFTNYEIPPVEGITELGSQNQWIHFSESGLNRGILRVYVVDVLNPSQRTLIYEKIINELCPPCLDPQYGERGNCDLPGTYYADPYCSGGPKPFFLFFTARADLKDSSNRNYGFFNLQYEITPVLQDGTTGKPFVFESRQRVFKESPLCTVPSGYVIANQIFPAGSVISKQSLRNNPLAFCWSMPAMLLDSNSNSLIQYTTEPYVLLSQNSTYTVPANNSLNLFYISTPLTQTRACDVNYYVNENGDCVPLPGWEFYCANGTWSETEHACLVQAVTRCVEGVYDENTNQCIKFIQPSTTEFVCPTEFPNLINDNNVFKCVNYVNNTEQVIVCPEGFTLKTVDQQLNKYVCEKTITEFECPAGATLKQTSSGSYACYYPLTPVCEKGVLSNENGNWVCKYFPPIQTIENNEPIIEIPTQNNALLMPLSWILIIIGVIVVLVSPLIIKR